MAVTKQQARKVRQPVLNGDLAISAALDATTTVDIVTLSSVAEKVTVQSDGTLAGTVEFSINGVTFYGSTAFTAGVPLTYSTHLVRVIKVTRTGGAGKLHMVAR
jgi:hypothetical protein